MNVSTGQLKAYIEAFHSALESTAAASLPAGFQQNLLHTSLLPAKITGYLSTQFGVAIEYAPAAATSVEVVKGSARIEDLLVDAPRAVRGSGPVVSVGGSGIGFANLILEGAFPFRLTAPTASVTFSGLQFRIGSWKREVHYAEVWADRGADLWSIAKAESRAKNEVLTALVQLLRAKERKLSLSEYIEKFKNRTVLLLGDYDPLGMKRLAGLSAALSGLGYEPVLVKDLPDHPYQDLPQKVVAVGAVSRFIVVDDSSKSGHLLEIQLCKQNAWVTALLRSAGNGGSWMTAGASIASNVIIELPYDPSDPTIGVGEATKWAEAKLQELERKFDSTYPWRQKPSA